ncbi:bifunctional 2-polyprenyl-6-hydroxyphenol methylase/3-demethylubiquinol 3-O-methyltransferase UbiG, partial [Limnohabitans sp. Rim8]|uniref:class I SAM-dependent methyltransferase n=1 Tax=Limnohabitans sp. Rim8 TaxID=1100718 RepID=UPI002633722F
MTTFANPKARWDYRFARPDYIFGTDPNAFLASQKDRLPQGKALAVADGEGRNSVWLAQQGLQVDAFDFSEPAGAKARHLAERRQVKVAFHLSDWQSFAWPLAHYDCVVGIFFQFVDTEDRAVLFKS